MSKPFVLETDASDVGVGAVLSQEDMYKGLFHRLPIAFASKLLNKAECNYLVTDKEGLAIVWAVRNFHWYIHGTKFTVITDHSALAALTNKVNLSCRLASWANYLSEFDLEIIYRLGVQNFVADHLSGSFKILISDLVLSDLELIDQIKAKSKN